MVLDRIFDQLCDTLPERRANRRHNLLGASRPVIDIPATLRRDPELECIEASRFDDELRAAILREEFDSWLQEECIRMLNKLKVPA